MIQESHTPTDPPPQRQPRRNHLAALLVVGVIAAAAIVLAVVLTNRRPPTATRHDEPAMQRQREISDAFSGGAAVSEQDHAAIQATFDAFAGAIKAHDATAIAALINAGRMIDEIEAQGLSGKMPAGRKANFAKVGAAGMANSFLNNPAMQFDRFEVRKVRSGASADEAVAYVRCRGGIEDGGGKMRWWVRRNRDGVWQLYDFEDLDSSIRISDFVAMAIAADSAAGGTPPLWITKGRQFPVLLQACAKGDMVMAEAALAQMEGGDFHPQLDALRLVMKGIVRTAHDDFGAALKFYDQAEALHPDLPIVHFLRAAAYNLAGRSDEAIASARKYLDILGDDAKTYAELGQAYETLNRTAEAAAAYQKGLAEDPNSVENREGLARVGTQKPSTTRPAPRP
jgi:hypothetical protein